MRIKLNGAILESNNNLVVEQWKKAGYAEVGNKGKLSAGEPQGDNESPKDDEPTGETKKSRKKTQE